MYTTEYQQSFLNHLKEYIPPWKNNILSQKVVRPSPSKVLQCSIGVQANNDVNNKKVHFREPEQSPILVIFIKSFYINNKRFTSNNQMLKILKL